jgi:hypothetical protein
VARDDRPQYQHGLGTIGGSQFHWGSGTPGQYWSIPYGDYPVTPNAPTGDWAHRVGAIPIANNVIPDPLLGRNRIGIMIHSGSSDSLDQLYTQGCFKVAPQEWPAVRSEILKEAANGPLYLHVAPGGVAAFTNTKTFSQAGDETPAANANAAANTVAAPNRPVTATPGTTLNSPLDIVLNAESGDRNIPNTHATTSSGQAQGNAQITTGTWNDFAPRAGVDLKRYPTPMDAPRDVQIKVANVIPLNRWAASTVNAVSAKYPGIDTSQTLGAIQSAVLNGGSGAPGPIDPSIIALGGYSPPIPGTTINNTAAPAAPEIAARGTLPGFGGKEASDKFIKDAQALTGQPAAAGGKDDPGQAAAFNPPPAHRPMALPGEQVFGNTLTSMMTPPQWSSQSPGQAPYAGAGAQADAPIGTSLASLAQLQQLMALGKLGANPFGGGYG